MMGSTPPKYDWGMRVKAVDDIFNDGSYPDRAEDELLAAAGAVGEVVQVGYHTEAKVPVYIVEFSDTCVVGCLEAEIVPA